MLPAYLGNISTILLHEAGGGIIRDSLFFVIHIMRAFMRYLALVGIYRCFLSYSSSLDDACIGKARRYLEFCIVCHFRSFFFFFCTESLPLLPRHTTLDWFLVPYSYGHYPWRLLSC